MIIELHKLGWEEKSALYIWDVLPITQGILSAHNTFRCSLTNRCETEEVKYSNGKCVEIVC